MKLSYLKISSYRIILLLSKAKIYRRVIKLLQMLIQYKAKNYSKAISIGTTPVVHIDQPPLQNRRSKLNPRLLYEIKSTAPKFVI